MISMHESLRGLAPTFDRCTILLVREVALVLQAPQISCVPVTRAIAESSDSLVGTLDAMLYFVRPRYIHKLDRYFDGCCLK